MLIRTAISDDLDQIVDFQLKMALETEEIELHLPTVLKGVAAVLEDSTKGRYYVAEISGKIVGSLLTTFEWSDWRNGTVLWIQSVYVIPEFRRQGVYRSMYTHIKKQVMESEDLKGIRLYADKSNNIAHETYLKLGMNADHYKTFEWLK